MKLKIMGRNWTLEKRSYQEDSAFQRDGVAGYCNTTLRRIVCCNMDTHPEFSRESEEWRRLTEQEVLRHEIVHAFFGECGLQENAATFDGPWPLNEEMIDWFAHVGERIHAAWKAAGCAEVEE